MLCQPGGALTATDQPSALGRLVPAHSASPICLVTHVHTLALLCVCFPFAVAVRKKTRFWAKCPLLATAAIATSTAGASCQSQVF